MKFAPFAPIYSLAPTKLHELIAEKHWILALERIKAHKGEVLCKRKYGIDGNQYKFYPLHLACLNKAPLELIKELLRVFPRAIKSAGLHGDSYPVHHAIIGSASPQVIQYLLEQWPDVLLFRDNNNLLPLHHAIVVASPPSVIQALIVGPTLKERDFCHGQTPLHLAAASGSPMVVIKRLVWLCPEACKMKDKARLTPLDCAILQGRAGDDVIEYLAKKSRKLSHVGVETTASVNPPITEIEFARDSIVDFGVSDMLMPLTDMS